MPFSTAGANRMLDAWAGTASGSPVTHSSLHSALPSDVGSNEISGGSPAYARKATGFDAASSGSMNKNSTDPIFDIPAATTVFYVGYWTALTAGTFMGFGPLNGGSIDGYATANATGDVFTSYAHGLVTNDRVALKAAAGASLPAGLSATILYYVVTATTDTYQVSLTQGGAAVDITASNEVYFQKVIGEAYGSQGTLTFDTATIDLG